MDARQAGQKLVDLCKAGKCTEAVNTLYADNVINVEAGGPPGKSLTTEGLAAVKADNVWFMENHEIHGSTVDGPWPHGDRFIVRFDIDITPKVGPMAGKRFQMKEAGLYTVKDGKVVKEEFFYAGM